MYSGEGISTRAARCCRCEGSSTGYPNLPVFLPASGPQTLGCWGSLSLTPAASFCSHAIHHRQSQARPRRLLPGQAVVGRPGALGNTFVVGRDGCPQEVIAQDRRWLWERLQEPGSAQERELRRLLEVVRAAVLLLAGVEGN